MSHPTGRLFGLLAPLLERFWGGVDAEAVAEALEALGSAEGSTATGRDTAALPIERISDAVAASAEWRTNGTTDEATRAAGVSESCTGSHRARDHSASATSEARTTPPPRAVADRLELGLDRSAEGGGTSERAVGPASECGVGRSALGAPSTGPLGGGRDGLGAVRFSSSRAPRVRTAVATRSRGSLG
jgi:hypothetical protein